MLLGDLRGNSVHVGDTLLGQGDTGNDGDAIVLVGDLTNELGGLELVKAVADNLTGRESSVLGLGAVSLLGGVVLTEGLDTRLSADVQLVGNGGGTDVEPVRIVRAEVLEARGLVVDGPLSKNCH